MRALVAAVICLTLAGAVYAAWPRKATTKPNPCGAVEAQPSEVGLASAGRSLLCLLNAERTQRGLSPLRQNGLLDQSSLEHSQDMVRRRYFEHTSADGRTVADRIRAGGYSHGFSSSAGENIAFGVGASGTPAHIVELWMHSKPHRKDILRPAFTEIGIGIALGSPEGDKDAATYTTDFGGVVDPSLPNS